MTRKYSAIRNLALVLIAMMPLQVMAQPMSGLWEIQGTPDGAPGPVFTNLAQNSPDGRVINMDPWFGTGLGKWTRLTGQTYTIEFTHYFLDAGNVGEVRVQGELQLASDHQSFAGTFVTEISFGGVVVDSVTGTVAGLRQ